MTKGATQLPSSSRWQEGGRLPAEVRFQVAVGAEQIRIGQPAAQRRIALRASMLPRIESMVPPLMPAAERDDQQRGVGEFTGAVGDHPVGEQLHPQVRRHRVEATGMHDPRAGGHRNVVEFVDAVPDERRLAGQIGVGGPGRRAGAAPAAARAGRTDRRC